MRRRWHDALVLAAVAAVALAAAVDALRPGVADPGAPRRAQQPLPAVAVPARVPLRGSPETAFLPSCDPGRLVLAIAPGPSVVLRYAGPPCQLAGLELGAVVRDADGTTVYRGPATERDAFARNLAGRQAVGAPLLPELLRCRAQMALAVAVRGDGLEARGAVRCRGEF